MSELRALPGFVLIEPIKDNDQEKGFLLPETVAEKPAKGKVIHGGDFIDDGLIVRFKRYAGQEFREDSKDLLLIKEEDIMGVYE